MLVGEGEGGGGEWAWVVGPPGGGDACRPSAGGPRGRQPLRVRAAADAMYAAMAAVTGACVRELGSSGGWGSAPGGGAPGGGQAPCCRGGGSHCVKATVGWQSVKDSA